MKIRLIPINLSNTRILSYLKTLVSRQFNADVSLGSHLLTTDFIKDEIRNQYHSTSILNLLSRMKDPREDILLGIADVDLYVPSLNFVFGEADPTNTVALISIARLRPSFYGLPDDERLLFKRTGKEAVHELGHVVSLKHCTKPSCVMFFSNSLADTDRKEDTFCQLCRRALEKTISE